MSVDFGALTRDEQRLALSNALSNMRNAKEVLSGRVAEARRVNAPSGSDLDTLIHAHALAEHYVWELEGLVLRFEALTAFDEALAKEQAEDLLARVSGARVK